MLISLFLFFLISAHSHSHDCDSEFEVLSGCAICNFLYASSSAALFFSSAFTVIIESCKLPILMRSTAKALLLQRYIKNKAPPIQNAI
ncbi:MAG TPA: hypothetical protein PKW98_01150 [Candidatus Wallbacteria bacterium]|nr:hypothetical protein [Candidatus Wallbacteria bacterium]HPG56397.1 hypothetical protein [Candidatus Wallbacteria bacterium]